MKLEVLAVALAGCTAGMEPSPLPRIVSAEPQGKGVAPDAVVGRVTFSEPVDPGGLIDGQRFALVKSAHVIAVSRAAASVSGIGPEEPVIEAVASLADGGRVAEIKPVSPLEPDSGYALIVGEGVHSLSGRPVLDPTGRLRTFVATFETGAVVDRQPPVARWALPPNGPVPRNIRRIEIVFDETVSGSLSVEQSPSAVPLVLAPDRLGLELQDDLADELAVSLETVQDSAGNRPNPLEPLSVSNCSDVSAPVLSGSSPSVEAAELSIRLGTTIDEMARLGVQLRAASGEEACGAIEDPDVPIERWGDVLPCPGQDPCNAGVTACEGMVEAAGLCPGRRFVLRAMAEDLAGNRSALGPEIEVSTADPRPVLVLTEVLVEAANPGADGEYIEVANIGTGEADLTGYRLNKRSESGKITECDVESVSGGPVQPGGHAVVVGGAYDYRYTLPSGAPVYRCGAGAILGGLANGKPPAVLLLGTGGETLSSIGILEVAPKCGAELSVERVHPAGPDAASNFACATTVPGTPGVCNHATPESECPKRPW